MENTVYSTIADILGMDEEEIKVRADENGLWDSLKRVELIFALEDELGIMFEPEDIEYMTTPNRIIEVVEKKNA